MHREVSAKTNTDEPTAAEVGVTPVVERAIGQHLTVSSEFVPFQEIDIYAKEAGYVKDIYVDYGSRVKTGQLLALLEIPELEASLQEDEASISAQTDQVMRADREVNRAKAQYTALHLQYQRLASVAKQQVGLVAQQEVDERIWPSSPRWKPRKARTQRRKVSWSWPKPSSRGIKPYTHTPESPRLSTASSPSAMPTLAL
jgi:pyruvate/2-oxoglutarate dehydrogenase complex dihydrolipoamide acyltransferase (E2) component